MEEILYGMGGVGGGGAVYLLVRAILGRLDNIEALLAQLVEKVGTQNGRVSKLEGINEERRSQEAKGC